MVAITDQDGDVVQIINGAMLVTGAGTASPPVGLYIIDGTNGALKATVDSAGNLHISTNDFTRILKFEPRVGEEIRRDETTTDDYHGVAADGTLTSSATWSVVRFYKTAGLIVRVRYRTGVVWDSRTVGWT